jgi:hypothetical protein
MKKLLSIILAITLLVGFGLVAAQASTSITEAQLIGRWRVTITDNTVFNVNDVLVFNAGGTGQVIRANGTTIAMSYQFVQQGNVRFLRLTSNVFTAGSASFSQVSRAGDILNIATTRLVLVQEPAPGTLIPGTDRPATTWNWFLFIFLFGWLWM